MFVVIISILIVLVIILVVAAAVVFTLRSSQDGKATPATPAAPAAPAAPGTPATPATPAAPADQASPEAPGATKKLFWHRLDGRSYVHGVVFKPRTSTADGSVTFAGDTDSTSECQTWCEGDPSCLGYTHVGKTGTDFQNQCYFVKINRHMPSFQNNHQSGMKIYA